MLKPPFQLQHRIGAVCLFAIAGVLQAAPTRGLDVSSLPEPLKKRIQYFGDVHPILAEHCISCHGPDKQKGGLRLDARQFALEGGESYGPAIVPGKSTESPLIQFMGHLEPDMEMPPSEDMRPKRELAVLRAWIDQGAKWPAPKGGVVEGTDSTLGNQELFFTQAADHWAYQPVAPLTKAHAEAASGQIDSLIRQKLEAADLPPSPSADARTLIRRLHHDLTGVPPSPAAVEVFVSAHRMDADQAVAELVDRLLDSPQFGERWARYWLDIARYANTRDFLAQADLRYPYAWTYRDYVVNAFNDDKPYDRFLKEQIAADQLGLKENHPALAGLGFITVGPRFRGRSDEIVNDRIDVVTRGLMATTVACARCHDHKFDPVRTEDFYALYGVFASTQDLETMPEIVLKGAMPSPENRKDYEKALAEEQKALAKFVQGLKEKAIADICAKPELYFDAIRQMEVAKSADVRKLITGGKMVETALTPLGSRWNAMKREKRWLSHPAIGPMARVAAATPDRKSSFVEVMIKTGRIPGGGPAISPLVLNAIKAKKPKDDAGMLKIYGEVFAKAKGAKDPASKAFMAAMTGEDGWLDFNPDVVERAHRLLGKGRRELGDLYEAITEVEATHPGAPPRAMAVADRENLVKPVVYVRGDPRKRGDAVDRRFLEVLEPSKKPFAAEASGRRELAEMIASRENPLTGRVWANQVWRHLFGEGIVGTTGDFGLQVERPVHAELLDFLAAALMDLGWSTKSLIRDIVLSKTYRQSSADRSEAREKDVLNTLFWRANRRRMDFEAMRDAMLAVSGRLDLTMGGRAVDLSEEPFSPRRTIYGHVDRTNLDPLFTTFDFPSPDIAATERSETMVPQQALFALNDGFIIDQARSLAKLARESAGDTADASGAVDWMYRQVFLRQPSETEGLLASSFIKEAASQRGQAMRGSWIYGFGSADPAVPAGERLRRLPYYDSKVKRYQIGRVYPNPKFKHVSITANGGHPGHSLEHASIRRWIAPFDGEIEIQGELVVNRQNNGDGVRGRLLSSRAGLVREWIADGKPSDTRIERLTVKRGEVLDFAVDCRETATSDGFRWTPSIRFLLRAEEAPSGVKLFWDSQADFSAPPPPPLQPLEQLAHALLMTNEFLFVD
jgi:mono/diheme cytochrome c family protein